MLGHWNYRQGSACKRAVNWEVEKNNPRDDSFIVGILGKKITNMGRLT